MFMLSSLLDILLRRARLCAVMVVGILGAVPSVYADDLVCDFSDATERAQWTFLNANSTNRWRWSTYSTAQYGGSTYSLLVTSNTSNSGQAYANSTSTSYTWVYRKFTVESARNVTVSFYYRNQGENNYDYMYANVSTSAPTAAAWSSSNPAGQKVTILSKKAGISSFTAASSTLTNLPAGDYYLSFFWRCDGSGGSAPAGTVANVVISNIVDPKPYSITYEPSDIVTYSATDKEKGSAFAETLPAMSYADPSFSSMASIDGWRIEDVETGELIGIYDAGDEITVAAHYIAKPSFTYAEGYPKTYTFYTAGHGITDTVSYTGLMPPPFPRVQPDDGWLFSTWSCGEISVLPGATYPVSGPMTEDMLFYANYTEVFSVLGWKMNTANAGLWKTGVADTVIIQFTKVAKSVKVTPYTVAGVEGTSLTTTLSKAGVYTDTCIYKVPVTADVLTQTTYRYGQLKFTFYNASDVVEVIGYAQMPAIVFPTAATTAGTELVMLNEAQTSSAIAGSNKMLQTGSSVADLVVTPGSNGLKLTAIDGYTFRNIYVYGGARLDIPMGVTVNVRGNVYLRSGELLGNRLTGFKYLFRYPQLKVEGNLVLKNNGTVFYDMILDTMQWYSFCVPYDVNLSSVRFWNGESASRPSDFQFMEYNGAKRALFTDAWIANDSTAWRLNTDSTRFVAGKGYVIIGTPAPIRSDYAVARARYQSYAMLRFPLTESLPKGEINQIRSVPALPYAGAKAIHSGWNLVGNPYMANYGGLDRTTYNYTGNAASNTVAYAANGINLTQDGDTYLEQLKYVVIPSDDGMSYKAYVANSTQIPAFKNYFVQIVNSATDSLTYPLAARRLSPWYATEDDDELKPEDDLALTLHLMLSNGTVADEVNLLVGDYSDEYEINADLAKWTNVYYNLYAMKQTDKLSYIALNPSTASERVPLGFTLRSTLKNGKISMSRDDVPYEVEHVWLYDVTKSKKTDLLSEDYVFSSTIGDFPSRFYLQLALREKMPTDVRNVVSALPDMDADKFMYNGNLYILKNGVLYNSLGQCIE